MGPLFDSPMFCLRIVFEPHVAATSGRLYSLAPSRWRASVLLQPRASSWPHVLTVRVTVEMENRFVIPLSHYDHESQESPRIDKFQYS